MLPLKSPAVSALQYRNSTRPCLPSHTTQPAAFVARNAVWDKAGSAAAAVLSAALVLSCPTDIAFASLAVGQSVSGVPRVVDGDTLYVEGNKIRLYGIDAPEKAQLCKDSRGSDYACGQVSLQALTTKLANKTVRCDVKAVDQYGRNVAACAIPGLVGQEDVNGWLVENGFAVAYRQYGKEYIPTEEVAHAARRGVWQGSFTMPAEWRKAQKAGGATSSSSSVSSLASVDTDLSLPGVLAALVPGGGLPGLPATGPPTCPGGAPAAIKGNINSKKEKIYHVPGGRYYESTQIELSDGERFFCNEQEAVAAGWRKSSQ